LRSAVGPAPPLDEYRRRFPRWVASGREIVDAQATVDQPGRTLRHARPPAGDTGEPGGHVLLSTGGAGSDSTRYSLMRLHAEGGLGRIWVAHDGSLDRDVALKELKPHTAQDADAWRRFLREAQVTGQLEHPNIVPVYELNRRDDERPFYTMRLVKGKTLREAIAEHHDRRRARRSDPLELPRLLQALVSVCQAVSYAHSRGVIHRDIKPDNIILGDFGEVLVLDWGLAKTRAVPADAAGAGAAPSSPDATAHGSVVGTPAYMAPEQAAGRIDAVDERTDVYGLGAVLFEILTGRPPRTGKNVQSLLAEAVDRQAPRVRDVASDVPAPLDAVCARAMAHRRENRYAAAVDLAADLLRYLADEPTGVYREPLTRRIARRARKHRTAFAVSLTLALMLAAVGVGGLFLRQHLDNRHRLDAQRQTAEVRTRAAVDVAGAIGELRENRFDKAIARLRRAERDLAAEPALESERSEAAATLGRALRIERFHARLDEGELREFFEQDELAAAAIDDGLRSLGVFDADAWWTRLPIDDLEPLQAERLREDVFRALLLLAAVRAKRGLARFPAADPEIYREIIDLARRADAWRPSQSARVLETFARIGLSPLEALTMERKPVLEPSSQTDLYFVGLMHYWASRQNDSVSGLLKLVAPLTGMRFDRSAAESERMLRAAVAENPRHFWTWLFLGWTQLGDRSFTAAELTFDTCLALRPDSALAHAYRGMTLVLRSKTTADPVRRADELRRGLADGDRAERLDPLNSEIIGLHSHLLADAGRNDEAKQAVLRCLDLEPLLADYAGRRIHVDKEAYLRAALAFTERMRKQSPDDDDLHLIAAEARLRLGEFAQARTEAEHVLRLRPNDARALSVLGACELHAGRTTEAAATFARALGAAPTAWHALHGEARASAAAGDWQRALTRFDAARDAARVPWQQAATLIGRAACCDRLNRPAEAEAALRQALELDPTVADPR